MSYSRYLCLFAHSGVQHILCCVFGLFFFVCCQFLLIVFFALPLRYSLTFIYNLRERENYIFQP
jgi:1-acyl-sn-glycerol-3-phosphate acyltransferase